MPDVLMLEVFSTPLNIKKKKTAHQNLGSFHIFPHYVLKGARRLEKRINKKKQQHPPPPPPM